MYRLLLILCLLVVGAVMLGARLIAPKLESSPKPTPPTAFCYQLGDTDTWATPIAQIQDCPTEATYQGVRVTIRVTLPACVLSEMGPGWRCVVVTHGQ